MKECPRCGSTLSHYAHGDGEAYGCDTCGWVGVDVEHRSEPVRLESWTDAITRFESKFGSSDTENVPGTLERVDEPIRVPEDESDDDPEPTIERVTSDHPVDEPDDDDDPDEPSAADDASEPESDDPTAGANDADADESTEASRDAEPTTADADGSAEADPDTTDDDTVDDENQAEAA